MLTWILPYAEIPREPRQSILETSPPWVDDGWMDRSSFHGVSVDIGQRLSLGKTFFFLVLFKQIHNASKKKTWLSG